MRCLNSEYRKQGGGSSQGSNNENTQTAHVTEFECCGRPTRGSKEPVFASVADLDELKRQSLTLQSEVHNLKIPQLQDAEPFLQLKGLTEQHHTQVQQLRFDLDGLFVRVAAVETKLTCMEARLTFMNNPPILPPEKEETQRTIANDASVSKADNDIDAKIREAISLMREEIKCDLVIKTPRGILEARQNENAKNQEAKNQEDINSKLNEMASTMKQDIECEVLAKVLLELKETQVAESCPLEEAKEKEENDLQGDCGGDVVDDIFKPYYTFQESIWDLTLFMFLPQSGKLGTVITGILCVLNVFSQLAFCIVVYLNFTGNDFDEDAVDGLKTFRLHTAHDQRYAESSYTLALGICNDNKSFNWRQNRYLFAASQLQTLSSIDSYLSDRATAIEHIFNGRTMCILALSCWCLTSLQEIRSILHFFNAILAMPIRKKTLVKFTSTEFTWIYISWERFVVSAVIALLRTVCCLFLMYCGCVWLSYTDDASDLLLNAVVLSFVINVDELLFAAATPLPNKWLISITKPIHERRWLNCHGVDMFSVWVLVTFPILTLIFTLNWVMPMIQDMKTAREVLCDGDRSFSYSEDATGLIWYQEFHAKKSDPVIARISAATTKSKRQLISRQPPVLANPTVVGGSSPLKIGGKSFAELVSFANRGCEDIVDHDTHPDWRYKTFLEEFMKAHDLGVATCATACAALGTSPELTHSSYVRFVCSETCGCRRPDSRMPSNKAHYGCGDNCYHTSGYKDRLYWMPCTDPSVAELEASDFWHSWTSFMNTTHHKYGNKHAFIYAAGMKLYGCGFLKNTSRTTRVTLCEGTDPFVNMRAFAPICPYECGCQQYGSQACNPYCYNASLAR